MSGPTRSTPRARWNRIGWQGWRLQVPAEWNPLKLDGDAGAGLALLVDLHTARLGLKWGRKPRRKTDVDKWVARLMRDEAGRLAAEKARPLPLDGFSPALLYEDPEPPGRDLWIGYSAVSGRALLVVYHAQRRDRVLAETILPTLSDQPPGEEQLWSAFDLSCSIPGGMRLLSQRLNAGDLSLTFADPSDRKRILTVRQVAVAQLALARMPLKDWATAQHRLLRRHYRPAADPQPVELPSGGDALRGVLLRSRRRRRFFWMRWLAADRFTYALRDAARDRLVIVESTDDDLARKAAASVGK